MPASASTAESTRVVELFAPTFARFGIFDAHLETFLVRKCAHAGEYAVLCVLGSGMARSWCEDRRRARALAVFVWMAVPCVDETIQLFVPGREGCLRDVCIDLAGGIVGFVVARQPFLTQR